MPRFAPDTIATRTRDEWCALLEGTDVCFAPVLSLDEVHTHRHAAARGTYVEVDGVVQPGPAPRFDRSVPAMPRPAPEPGLHTEEVLSEAGFGAGEIASLRSAGVIR